MSNEWNIDNIRKIAGLPLVESRFDNDDDEDPDAKVASSDKRQAAFEKRNKSEIRRAEKEADNKEKVAARKAAEEKQPADVKKAEPKAEAKPAEAKEEPKEEDKEGEARSSSRGRKPSDSSKMGQARKWIHDHPSATRGEFMKHAESFNMSRHYANAFFYSVKKKMKVEECYILVHPNLPSFVLAENRELNQMQWVDPTSPLDPMVFESREEAEKIAKYMSEWKSQYVDILTITLAD